MATENEGTGVASINDVNTTIELKTVGYLHDQLTVRGNCAGDTEKCTDSESIESMLSRIPSNSIRDGAIVSGVKNIVFNLIMTIPFLRAKMGSLLENPSLTEKEIHRILSEVRGKITEAEMAKLRQYMSVEHNRNTLLGTLSSSFTNILEDGKIDMNDATHFLTLVYDIIQLFNNNNSNTSSAVNISGDTMMFFLYFVIKCIIVLTMDDPEEATALGLLDTAFRLVSVTVAPIMKMNCCSIFRRRVVDPRGKMI